MKRPSLTGLVCLAALLAGCAGLAHFEPSESSRRSGTVATTDRPRPDSLRVVSYNIQYGEQIDQALADLQADPDLHNADILLLQEMDGDGVAAMARALDLNFVYYPASIHPHHDKQFGNAVLSRWPITASRLLVLPHKHPLSGDLRTATSADIDVDGVQVRAVSVHTATVVLGQEQRLAQAQTVADSLTAVAGPLVIGGDFNTVTQYEGSLLRRIFRDAGCSAVHLPPGSTIKGWKSGVLGDETVLDHIFYRGLQAGDSRISKTALASDHYPVWTVLGWTENNPQK